MKIGNRMVMLIAGSMVVLFAEPVAAQQETFVVVSATTAREIAGSNEGLGVSGSWVAPEPNVMAVVVTARVNVKMGAKVSSGSFKLRYRVGSQTESRRCIAFDMRVSEKDKLRLAFAASQSVEWTSRSAGAYFVTLAFINVPSDTREATLLRDDAVLAEVRVSK